MKQTNYLLYDFLDLDPGFNGEEGLWKTCFPTGIRTVGTDVVVELPFQRQKDAHDLSPDLSVPRRTFLLRLRAYGDRIVRMSVTFEGLPMAGSPMLKFSPGLTVSPLRAETVESGWLVRDNENRTRAWFSVGFPETDVWSNLVPPPEETLVMSVFPDGDKEVQISSWDQFFPARNDAMALAFIERQGNCHRAALSFHAEPDEKFAGTGERFAKMDLSGRTFQLKNQDGQGVNNRRTYKNIPFYLSSRKYGLFIHTSAFTKLSLAGHSSRSVQMLVEEPSLDLFLIGGDSPEEILFSYRSLTGFPAMLPLWSFGTWMSRMSYFSAEEVNGIAERLREENYPCDVIHLDTGWFRTDWLCEWKFNEERFPDPEGFIRQLKENGFRLSLWQMPYIAREAAQHDEAVRNRYIGIPKLSEKQGGSNFSALDYAGTIDFTFPEAVEWYKNLLRELLKMGVSCIKTDFGEDIHMDAEYSGMDPERLNNLYALLYQQAAFEVTEEITGEGIIWARAGWSGCQRFPLHWGGDAASTWDGMAGSLKGGLHLGLSGFGFWSHDVPGFHGIPDFMNAIIPGDLYIRWTQFGVFSSHLRYHGTSKREPWHFPEVAPIVRKWWRLRYALLPYIIEESELTTRTGFPVLRALVFHHPGDPLCWHIDDQYYFGDQFLVAPVMNSENRRNVWLPEGDWVNLFSGDKTRGGVWLKDFEVPLEEMPVWVKAGAEIPVYPEVVNHTGEMDFAKVVSLKFDKTFPGLKNSILREIWSSEQNL